MEGWVRFHLSRESLGGLFCFIDIPLRPPVRGVLLLLLLLVLVGANATGMTEQALSGRARTDAFRILSSLQIRFVQLN